MRQVWIIDDEWSQYHSSVAALKGWGLTHRQGLWEITTQNIEKFPTDDDARLHVLACEADPESEEFTLAALAVHAVMVGNMRG